MSLLLARELLSRPPGRHGVRFLFAPGTIGAITWLARNQNSLQVAHGLTLTCLGDSHPFTFKKTFQGRSDVDRAASLVLQKSGYPHELIDFFPYGYDERQYNSPGFRLPVASLMRGRHGRFPEYHTSLDNPDFVSGERMVESYRVLRDIVECLQGNGRYMNLAPHAEPQLGKRGLYRAVGGTELPDLQYALLWVLNMSDGQHSLLAIAERAGLPFKSVQVAARLLLEHELLAEVG